MVELQVLIKIGAGLVAGAGAMYYLKNKNEPKEININNNIVKAEISDKLKKLEEEFMQIATSYYLRLGLLKSELSTEKQKNILSEYPKVISQPNLKWNNFTIINEEGMLLNKLIEEKIQDYAEKDSYREKDAFNYLLLEKAEKRAQEIIIQRESC